MGTLYDLLKGTQIPGAGNRFWNWASKVSLAVDEGGGGGGGGDLIVENVLLVAKNGDDATGERNNLSKPFLTVGAAVQASVTGDLILIGPGAYVENDTILVDGKTLYVVGSGTTASAISPIRSLIPTICSIVATRTSPKPGPITVFDLVNNSSVVFSNLELPAAKGKSGSVPSVTLNNATVVFKSCVIGQVFGAGSIVLEDTQASTLGAIGSPGGPYNILQSGGVVENISVIDSVVDLINGAAVEGIFGFGSSNVTLTDSSANEVSSNISNVTIRGCKIGALTSDGGSSVEVHQSDVSSFNGPNYDFGGSSSVLFSEGSRCKNFICTLSNSTSAVVTVRGQLESAEMILNGTVSTPDISGAVITHLVVRSDTTAGTVIAHGTTVTNTVTIQDGCTLDSRFASSLNPANVSVVGTGYWDRDQVVIPERLIIDTAATTVPISPPFPTTVTAVSYVVTTEVHPNTAGVATIMLSTKKNDSFDAQAAGGISTYTAFVLTRVN